MVGNLASHKIVSQEEWLEARKRLLTQEKESTRLRDRLSQQRRELPCRIVDHEIDAEEAVKLYHDRLKKLGIQPLRDLAADLQLTKTMMRYS